MMIRMTIFLRMLILLRISELGSWFCGGVVLNVFSLMLVNMMSCHCLLLSVSSLMLDWKYPESNTSISKGVILFSVFRIHSLSLK